MSSHGAQPTNNPLSFRPGAVTWITSLCYLGLLVVLVLVHETVPPTPKALQHYRGLDLDQAWLDLARISSSYHPYNSHANDELGKYLDQRIADTLTQNGCNWTSVLWGDPHVDGESGGFSGGADGNVTARRIGDGVFLHDASSFGVLPKAPDCVATVFTDMLSNVTMTTTLVSIGTNVGAAQPGLGASFQGTNRVVYVRGLADPPGNWWEWANATNMGDESAAGVLVNAHYDSVSTGYGATDNGMGVATMLQLIKYWTSLSERPEHGLLFMFNNGEEDFLWGARAFAATPLVYFTKTFLNLEGAGAGGRATLFRTTDAEVTKAYRGSPNPFGTVVSADGFKAGLIKSETDYVVLNGVMGMRGLDMAFFAPRSRYHTNQDDLKHTSRASLSHMLSGSLATTEYLSGKHGRQFVGPRGDADKDDDEVGAGEGKVLSGKGSDGVWFDVLGMWFAVVSMKTVFIVCVSLLVGGPVILLLLTWGLVSADKYYFFASDKTTHASPSDPEFIKLGGWRGFTTFPFGLLVAGGMVVGAAFLLKKLNPLVVYSSEYAVWAMMLSTFFLTYYSISKVAESVCASALTRGFTFMWLFILGWFALAGVTVLAKNFHIASGYVFIVFYTAAFLGFFISLLEMFSLDTQAEVAEKVREGNRMHESLNEHCNTVPHQYQRGLMSPGPGEMDDDSGHSGVHDSEELHEDEHDPLLTSHSMMSAPLLSAPTLGGGGHSRSGYASIERSGAGFQSNFTFANSAHRILDSAADDGVLPTPYYEQPEPSPPPYGDEQTWSGSMTTWTWMLQFLIMMPAFVLLLGQVGLLVATAVSQTGADSGTSVLLPYLAIAVFSILVLLPLTPFIHRVRGYLAILLFLVFAATMAYNILVFPFSMNSRFKVYFMQTVDLDSGNVTVRLMGLDGYTQQILHELPSAMGRESSCAPSELRKGLTLCEYDGVDVTPHLATNATVATLPPPSSEAGAELTTMTLLGDPPMADLVQFEITRDPHENAATFYIQAANTKACAIRFDTPVSNFSVAGAAPWMPRFGAFPKGGIGQIRLWRRDWLSPWTVRVEWPWPESKPPTVKAEEDQHDGDDGDDATAPRPLQQHRRYLRKSSSSLDHGTALVGKVVCLYNDANRKGTIPALDETIMYAPQWAAVTKMSDGLVECSKGFVA